MTNALIYCAVGELVADLHLSGEDSRLSARIREASQFILRNLGRFLPVHETRTLKGVSMETLNFGAGLLAVSEIQVDGVAITDYTLYPRYRTWENGPYTWAEREAGWGEEVTIEGDWGLYQETADLDLVADQTLDATTLAVPDGSVLSPGMLLALEDEQELVLSGNGGPKSPAPSAAASQIAAALDNASEEVSVDDRSEFFEGETIQVENEDLYIRKIGASALICGRGWNGTAKAPHALDTPLSVYRTYRVSRGANGTDAAAHTGAVLGRVLPPADVHWLALQVAALMKKKAETGFSGRSGDSATGDAFYINEFPRQIESIRDNYAIPYL
jgi:hypothetical protein